MRRPFYRRIPLGTRAAGSALLAVMLAGSALAVGACSSGDSDEEGGTTSAAPTASTTSPAAGAVLRLGVTGPLVLDPAVVVPTSHSQMMAADLLYDGLTAIDPAAAADSSEAVVPTLAESWEPNDDFTEWTFTLREGARFSDGSPIGPVDVKASLERLAVQGTMSLAGVRLEVLEGYEDLVAGDADEIEGIVAGDGNQVVLTTTEPFAPLPELLASPAFAVLPADTGPAGEAGVDGTVSSGPFVRVGTSGEEASGEGAPSVEGVEEVVRLVSAEGAEVGVDEVHLARFAGPDEAYEAFVAGTVDWSLVPGDRVEEAREAFGDEHVTPFHAELFFGIDLTDEAFASLEFRQALVQAVDRQAIVDELFPEGILLDGTVPVGVPGHDDDPCAGSCEHDPDAARDLVAEVFGEGEVPTVGIDHYEGEREVALATLVAEDLEAVGVPTELRPQTPEDYEAFVTSGDQELFLFGWVGIAPSADSYLAPLFLSGSPDNVTSFSTEAVDAGLAAARAFEDPADRAEAYRRVEESVMAQVPVIPLVQISTVAVVGERVSGWQVRLDGTFDVARVSVS